jgi:flagellar hook-length control protein FliK
MQRIDNYSLDLLFGNNSQDAQSNFLQSSRSLVSDMRTTGTKMADKLKEDIATEYVRNGEVNNSKKESFKEAVDKASAKSKEKQSQKKSSDDLIIEVNLVTTQILDEIDHKLSFEFDARDNFELEALDLDGYEKDISDTELVILPFAVSHLNNSESTYKLAENNSELITTNNKDLKIENNTLKMEVLNELSSKLDKKLETLTLELAKTNLKSESAVDKILDLSNQIEEISIVSEALKDIVKKSGLEDVLTSNQNSIEKAGLEDSVSEKSLSSNREVEVLLDSRLEKFIAKYHIQRTDKDLQQTISNPIKDLADAGKISSKNTLEVLEQDSQKAAEQVKELTNANRVLNFKDRIEILERDTSQEDNSNLSQEAKVSLNENSSLFISNSNSSNMSGSGQQSSQGNHTQSPAIQDLQQSIASSKATNVRSQVIKQSIPMERLTNFVAEKATQTPQGVKQDIKLLLNPENLGEVELSISKNGNKLDIKLVFANEKSLNQVEHKMNELNILLKSRGFEAKIELSHTNTNNSNNTSDQQNANSSNQNFNQAKEEQKNKYLDRPSWLDEKISIETLSFDEQLQGIIN